MQQGQVKARGGGGVGGFVQQTAQGRRRGMLQGWVMASSAAGVGAAGVGRGWLGGVEGGDEGGGGAQG